MENEETYEASTIQEYLEVIESIKSKFPGKQILYRGQGNYKWNLESTLERAIEGEKYGFLQYIRRIGASSGNVLAFANNNLNFKSLIKWAKKDDFKKDFKYEDLNLFFDDTDAYNVLAYFRQHGFPSPMLDWTESPQIALFFSINNICDAGAVYAYIETPNVGHVYGTDSPCIKKLGTYTVNNKRHILQKSSYTIAYKYISEEFDKYQLIGYDSFENKDNVDQDLIIKIKIKNDNKIKILKNLDEYNLNIYSLMQNEDSLMEYLAFREFGKYNINAIPGTQD